MNTQQRNTRQRALVLQVVRSRLDHPTADEIFADCSQADAHISRGTVYRNLNVLAEMGEIRHVKVPAAADRFDLRTEPHYHFLCTQCNRMFDIDLSYQAALDAEVARQSGCAVACHRTVFEGCCPDCRARLA